MIHTHTHFHGSKRRNRTLPKLKLKPQVRLTRGYLSAVVEVTGSGTKRPIPISLRPPSDPSASSSPWELLRAYSPVPPTLLLASAGVAVLLMGIALVALGGGFGKGGSGGKAD